MQRRHRGRRVCGARSGRIGIATYSRGMCGGTSIAKCRLRSYIGYVSVSSLEGLSRDCSLQSPEQLEGRDEPPINKVDNRRSPRLEKLLGA